MTELRHEITINAPLEQVFAGLANLELVQHYNTAVNRAEYISHIREGVGAMRQCDLGRDGVVKERVIAFEKNNFIEMELYEHNWPIKTMTWRTHVKQQGSITKVSQCLVYEMRFGPFGKVLNFLLVRPKMDKNLQKIFESMKAYFESSESTLQPIR